jgi:hypothetical protein
MPCKMISKYIAYSLSLSVSLSPSLCFSLSFSLSSPSFSLYLFLSIASLFGLSLILSLSSFRSDLPSLPDLVIPPPDTSLSMTNSNFHDDHTNLIQSHIDLTNPHTDSNIDPNLDPNTDPNTDPYPSYKEDELIFNDRKLLYMRHALHSGEIEEIERKKLMNQQIMGHITDAYIEQENDHNSHSTLSRLSPSNEHLIVEGQHTRISSLIRSPHEEGFYEESSSASLVSIWTKNRLTNRLLREDRGRTIFFEQKEHQHSLSINPNMDGNMQSNNQAIPSLSHDSSLSTFTTLLLKSDPNPIHERLYRTIHMDDILMKEQIRQDTMRENGENEREMGKIGDGSNIGDPDIEQGHTQSLVPLTKKSSHSFPFSLTNHHLLRIYTIYPTLFRNDASSSLSHILTSSLSNPLSLSLSIHGLRFLSPHEFRRISMYQSPSRFLTPQTT